MWVLEVTLESGSKFYFSECQGYIALVADKKYAINYRNERMANFNKNHLIKHASHDGHRRLAQLAEPLEV